ncbi:phosphoglycerate kinase [Lichenicoccus sp.]|uniref:phosphoglycerate kinase n=1 Tax=Lichenicoccus sp. TaxID=2781899 RepID=UPI003D0DF529
MASDPATPAVPEEKQAAFRTIDRLDCKGKRVLLRADLNVPVRDGRITDLTRLDRLTPTIRELADQGARVIVVSHFDRPKGVRVPSMSLAPIGEALAGVLGHPVHFAADCIGPQAEAAVAALHDGEVLVLENTRYHAGEEANDPEMARALASLADIYVNDAFSAAHRAHASTEGVARHLPAHAGRLMQAELTALTLALEHPERPVGAIVGGAKVSTKLDLIGNILGKVDVLIIGGAMANTFLAAQGLEVGRSLQEPGMHDTARAILEQARTRGCEILLPIDAVTATEFKAHAATRTVPIAEVSADALILDCGPETVALLSRRLGGLRTLVWNGPMGAFETPPFNAGTNALAQVVASLTEAGTLRSVAGGGDTVSALRQAGVMDKMSYVSTAGGAFLEWLEGKILPGIQALDALAGIVLPR